MKSIMKFPVKDEAGATLLVPDAWQLENELSVMAQKMDGLGTSDAIHAGVLTSLQSGLGNTALQLGAHTTQLQQTTEAMEQLQDAVQGLKYTDLAALREDFDTAVLDFGTHLGEHRKTILSLAEATTALQKHHNELVGTCNVMHERVLKHVEVLAHASVHLDVQRANLQRLRLQLTASDKRVQFLTRACIATAIWAAVAVVLAVRAIG